MASDGTYEPIGLFRTNLTPQDATYFTNVLEKLADLLALPRSGKVWLDEIDEMGDHMYPCMAFTVEMEGDAVKCRLAAWPETVDQVGVVFGNNVHFDHDHESLEHRLLDPVTGQESPDLFLKAAFAPFMDEIWVALFRHTATPLPSVTHQ